MSTAGAVACCNEVPSRSDTERHTKGSSLSSPCLTRDIDASNARVLFCLFSIPSTPSPSTKMSIAPVVSLFPGAHLYTVCPSNAMSGFNYAESPPAANQFAYTSSDASTNLMAAIARCDADVANASPCTGVDLWKGLIEVFPDVTVVGGASVVNFGVPEGFAIRQSSKGTFIQKYGDNFPANCFVCTSTADGACCLSPSVTTCDINGVAW